MIFLFTAAVNNNYVNKKVIHLKNCEIVQSIHLVKWKLQNLCICFVSMNLLIFNYEHVR